MNTNTSDVSTLFSRVQIVKARSCAYKFFYVCKYITGWWIKNLKNVVTITTGMASNFISWLQTLITGISSNGVSYSSTHFYKSWQFTEGIASCSKLHGKRSYGVGGKSQKFWQFVQMNYYSVLHQCFSLDHGFSKRTRCGTRISSRLLAQKLQSHESSAATSGVLSHNVRPGMTRSVLPNNLQPLWSSFVFIQNLLQHELSV